MLAAGDAHVELDRRGGPRGRLSRWARSSSWTWSGSTSTWPPRWASSSGPRGRRPAGRAVPPVADPGAAGGRRPARPEDGRGLLPLRRRRAGHRAGSGLDRRRPPRRRPTGRHPRRAILVAGQGSPSGSRSRSSTRRTGRSGTASRPPPTSTWRCVWAPATRSGHSSGPTAGGPRRPRCAATVRDRWASVRTGPGARPAREASRRIAADPAGRPPRADDAARTTCARRSGRCLAVGLPPVQSPHDPRPAPPAPRGLDRRGRPHADRPLRRRPRERPAGRPRRGRHARGRRSGRHRPGARRGRHPRLRQPGRRGQPERRPDGAAARRLPGRGRRPDRQPAVRVGPPGDQLGGARDRGRRRRRVHRRRRRVDDPRAVRPAQAGVAPTTAAPREHGRHDARLAVRQPAPRRAPLPVLDGRDRRERRRALGRLAASARTRSRSRASSAPSPPSRPAGSPTRSCRSRSRSGRATRSSSTATSTRAPTPRSRRWRGSGRRSAEGGTVTAGNSSGINDGASARPARRGGPGARRSGCGRWPASSRRRSPAWTRRSWASGPIPATRKALERAGIGVGDLDLVELNEAFASQSLVCIDELGLDPARVNVNGGAIALGHPLGMSGGRLITMLAHELRRTGGRYGLATMCIGVGQGIATVVERIDG